MKRGFTLIEMMISVALFSIVMLIAMTALLTLIEQNRRAQALNSVMTDLNFTLESVSRAARTGSDYDCGGAGRDCPISFPGGGSDRVTLRDQGNNLLSYRIESDGLYRNGARLTAEGVTLSTQESKFFVTGADVTDTTQQPQITLVLVGESVYEDETVSFSLQTTVTQRIVEL